jgi:hypothetical protein
LDRTQNKFFKQAVGIPLEWVCCPNRHACILFCRRFVAMVSENNGGSAPNSIRWG